MGNDSSKFSNIIKEKFTFKKTISSPLSDIKVYHNNISPNELVFCIVIKEDTARILINIEHTQKFLRSAFNVIRILAYEQNDSIFPLCGVESAKVYTDPFDLDLHTSIQKRRRN